MKKIKNFKDYSVNELSKELIDRTADIMKSKGQPKRAKNLLDTYNDANYDFSQFKNMPIFDDLHVGDIYIDNDDNVISIDIETEDSANYTINYDIENDKYLGLPSKNKISRKDVRLLGKIAAVINPNTQYKTGTGDIAINNY